MSADLFARDRGFWVVLGRAAVVGFLAGAAALAFNTAVKWGTNLIWPEKIDYDFLGGTWWWVVVLTVTGLVVGTLRVVLQVPEDLAGSLTILQGASVDRSNSLQAIGISIVTLVGGASLGPFDGGVRSGATVGEWYATIRGLPEEERESTTLSGINGALGGMLTAPILATLLVTELRWPDKRQYYRVLIPSLTGAIFGFVINFAILGDTFLGVFALPRYEVKLWHFGVAVILGFVGATLAWFLGLTVFFIRRWVVPRLGHPVLRAALGGLVLGLIAYVLPLTLASGKGQLSAAVADYEQITAGFLIAVLVGKIIAVAISLTTGFIGGPVMPALFIGGTAGLAVHVMIPEVPVTLAFACMLVAVPGVSLGTPFAMVLLASLTVGVGAVETVPAAIAVLTAYTLNAGMGWFGLPIDKATVDIDEVSVKSELFEIGEDTT